VINKIDGINVECKIKDKIAGLVKKNRRPWKQNIRKMDNYW